MASAFSDHSASEATITIRRKTGAPQPSIPSTMGSTSFQPSHIIFKAT